MNSKDFQNNIYSLLQVKLDGLEVKNEWVAFPGLPNQYSPRVDIAVGPFAIEQTLIAEYNSLIIQDDIRSFLSCLYNFHRENVPNEIVISDFDDLINKNQNARCFIAFEIENINSKKHIMGSIINAASLGRVGIGIAYSENALKTFTRILNYLSFLKQVEKNTYDTTNFLIITKEQMVAILNN